MRKFWIDCVLATVLVFLQYGDFSDYTATVFNAFDPIGQALSDVELTIMFSQHYAKILMSIKNIVIVNIGNLSRRQIGRTNSNS
jgi:hypothetical protein